eukprot:1138690-Pelagomonas_calceolata.AAC.1
MPAACTSIGLPPPSPNSFSHVLVCADVHRLERSANYVWRPCNAQQATSGFSRLFKPRILAGSLQASLHLGTTYMLHPACTRTLDKCHTPFAQPFGLTSSATLCVLAGVKLRWRSGTSLEVVEQMQAHFPPKEYPGLIWMQGDVTFDFVLDKATLDALLTAGAESATRWRGPTAGSAAAVTRDSAARLREGQSLSTEVAAMQGGTVGCVPEQQ